MSWIQLHYYLVVSETSFVGMLALHSSLADLAAPVLQPLLLSDSSQLGYWVVNHLVVLWLPGRSTAGLVDFCSG